MDRDLSGQVAVISGGLGDIGSAIARTLAKYGADIAIGDTKPAESAAPLLAKLTAMRRRAVYHQVDVSEATAVTSWIADVSAKLAAPSLIIPCAAIATSSSTCTITPEQWTRELRVNLDGSFFLAQACVQRLRQKQSAGRVVFIGSWAAHAPHTYIPAYCASKAGLRMLCKTMALELAPHNILVNEVAPGFVEAGLSAQKWAEDPPLKAEGLASVPTHQFITADEVAEEVAHLCDPANRHMTGATILMDGGLSLTNVSMFNTRHR